MMKRAITMLAISLSTVGLVGVAALGTVQAQSGAPSFTHSLADAKTDACQGIGLAGGGCGDNGAQLSKAVRMAINIFSIVVGVVATFMIIYSGFRFMTSSGDPSAVSGAKRGLIYAIVGLVIAATAQMITHFVLSNA